VVGWGLGADAEYTARLGFDTTGFDISASRRRQYSSVEGSNPP